MMSLRVCSLHFISPWRPPSHILIMRAPLPPTEMEWNQIYCHFTRTCTEQWNWPNRYDSDKRHLKRMTNRVRQNRKIWRAATVIFWKRKTWGRWRGKKNQALLLFGKGTVWDWKKKLPLWQPHAKAVFAKFILYFNFWSRVFISLWKYMTSI